jgi:cystathionine beta-lyase
MAALSAGDHLLMSDSVYGPSRAFADRTLKRLGIETTYYDPRIGAGDRSADAAEHPSRIHRIAGF